MKILLIDYYNLFSQGFKKLFEEYDEIEEVILLNGQLSIAQIMEKSKIDIILMEIKVEETSNLELAENIKKQFPNIPLVFMTWVHIDDWMSEIQKVGADAVISKRAQPDEVLEIIKRLEHPDSKKRAIILGKTSSELTEREHQVLELISQGYTQKEVASELGVSKRTVSSHVYSIQSKLKVKSTTEAVAKAVRQGIIGL